jgi:hypothetical protein
MPPSEMFRHALQALVAGTACKEDQQLIGDALRFGELELAEGNRSVALGGSANGATIVTGDNNVVLHIDAAAVPAFRALLSTFLADFTPVSLQDLLTASRNQLQQQFERTIKHRRYFPDSFLARAGFDTHFHAFLRSPRNILVLLADAGFGKTTMLGHWADLCVKDNDIVFFVETYTDPHFDDNFRSLLKLGFCVDDRLTLKRLLDLIEGVLLANNRYLVWFLDGLDKVPPPASQIFIHHLSEMLHLCHPTRIHFVLSCRTSIWPYINYIESVGRPQSLLTDDIASELHLDPFSCIEVKQLYALYRLRYICALSPLPMLRDLCCTSAGSQ